MKSYKEKHSDIIGLKLNKAIKNDRMEKENKLREYGKYKPYEVHKCWSK